MTPDYQPEGSELQWYCAYQDVNSMVRANPQEDISRDTGGDNFRKTCGSDSAELYEKPARRQALSLALSTGLFIFHSGQARETGAFSLPFPASSTVSSIPKASLVNMHLSKSQIKIPTLPLEWEHAEDTLTHFSLFPAFRPPGGYP